MILGVQGPDNCYSSIIKRAALLMLFLMVSCQTRPPATESKLLGEWQYADNTKACRYMFSKDGSFHGEVTYDGKVVSRFVGRWSVQGDTLFYRYTNDALGRIPAGATDRDKLLAISGNSFMIEAADGSRRRYIRRR